MTDLYRGYIRLAAGGKKAVDRFKDVPGSQLRTLEQAALLDDYAGVLADGVVLVDVDDEDMADRLYDIIRERNVTCRIVKTTRGRHFLFRNDGGVAKCGTHVTLACGLVADIKSGDHNSYEVLKKDGVLRAVEAEPDVVDELPKWLRPVKTSTDFLRLGAGDGRNQALFNHILALTGAGLSRDESRETLRIINEHILPEPLPADELDTLSRDDAFPEASFYDGKRFAHERFGDFVAAEHHLKRIDGQLHIYRDGVYVPGARRIEAAMLDHIRTLKATQRAEVLKYLEIIRPDDEPTSNANLLTFRNGVYDLTTGTLGAHSPDVVTTNLIPWDYEPDAYSALADKTLDKLACHDPEIRALLEECIGYTFYRRNELSKAFLLTGDKSNGKSTFLDMVKNVLGPANYSVLDLNELDERFSVATMAGKLANIGDDISDEFMAGKSVALFKKVVSGNQLKAEFKGQDAFFFSPYVKLLFSANDIPRIRDRTGAVLRRLVIVPFNAKFSKNDPDFDPYITHKLRGEEVMRYLVRLGVEGLRRVLENRGFTESERVRRELEQFEVDNNPILLFLRDVPREGFLRQPTRDLHVAYRAFCVENGFSEMTLISFVKEVNRRLGLTTRRVRVSGRLVSVFEEA